MKGANLNILILTIIGLSMAVLMVSLNLYASWSQYARSLEEPLLFAALTSFSSLFIIRSFTHFNKDNVLAKFRKMEYRVEHNNRITGYLFIGVLVTPVTHPNEIIETVHFLFTGCAIGFAYWELSSYYKTKTLLYWGSMLGLFCGILGFLGGFIFKFYSVGLGELLAALPISIHILSTLKKK